MLTASGSYIFEKGSIIMSLFDGKVLLIPGGTGSFGNAVLRRFLTTDIGEIRILSRDEKKQDDMWHQYQEQYPEYIPIFHMEAGNRCFDECLPKETNRRIVDVTSDVNLCYSEHARHYLNASGVPKERTYVVGSPMAEVLHRNLPQIEASDIHTRLRLEKGKYILLSAHREENIDTEKNFTSLFTAVNQMAKAYEMPVLYSCHPRSRKRLKQSGFQLDKRVIAHEPLGFHDYNCLQMNAYCVVSDSGTLPEEASFFSSVGHPFPAVCIRTSTERPEALDKGCFLLSGIDTVGLLQAVEMAVAMNRNELRCTPVPDYTEENVSMKVARIIQGYTGIVNRMVWRKERP